MRVAVMVFYEADVEHRKEIAEVAEVAEASLVDSALAPVCIP